LLPVRYNTFITEAKSRSAKNTSLSLKAALWELKLKDLKNSRPAGHLRDMAQPGWDRTPATQVGG
jgi:hypothetical protein